MGINVRLHFPKSEKGIKEFKDRLDVVHSESYLDRVKKLDCSNEAKIQLLDVAIERMKAPDFMF